MPRKRKYKSPEQWYKAAMSEFDQRLPEYTASILRLRDQKCFNRTAEGYERDAAEYIDYQFDKAMGIIMNGDSSRSLKRALYFEHTHLPRRKAAVLQYLSEAVRRFSDKYPDLNIEHEFICLNAAPCYCNYDTCENEYSISLAIAIFILDELTAAGRLQEAIRYFPTEAEFQGMVRLPHGFHDPSYDNALIGALAYLIQSRNDGCSKGNVFIDSTSAEWTEERRSQLYTARGTEEIPVAEYTNRQRLDTILSLIRPDVIDGAVKRYEKKMWEFTDAVLRGIRSHRKELINACNKVLQILEDVQALRGRDGRTLHDSVVTEDLAIRESAGNVLKNYLLEEKVGSTFEQLERLIEKSQEMDDECKDIELAQINLRIFAAGALEFTDRFVEVGVDRDAVDALTMFTVDDPYEACFAFFWLLETGAGLPWLIAMGSGPVAAAALSLPWAHHETFDSVQDRGNTPPAEVPSLPEKLTKSIKAVDTSVKLYDLNCFDLTRECETLDDVFENYIPRNLPQLIFSRTGLVMPRRTQGFEGIAEAWKKGGLKPDFPWIMELYLLLAEVRQKSYHELAPYMPGGHLSPEYAAAQQAAQDEVAGKDPREDSEELNRQIREYKRKLRGLEGALAGAERKRTDAEKKLARMEEERASERQELYGLRELIYQLNNGEKDEPEHLSPEIHFPYTAKKRLVSFGGHPSWRNAMQRMLPNVRFVPGEVLPNTVLIRNADMIWIQPDAISHSHFYKIADVGRTNKIPVLYFAYAGAEKCARQLVAEDVRTSAKT